MPAHTPITGKKIYSKSRQAQLANVNIEPRICNDNNINKNSEMY